jgi:hypothetical protein
MTFVGPTTVRGALWMLLQFSWWQFSRWLRGVKR